MYKRSWIEIDLDVIKSNYNYYKSRIDDNQEIMAVVKANAYGHGDFVVANALQSIGCKHFAVSNLDEAISLREHGIIGQILILGYTPISCSDIIRKYDITQTIVSEEYAEKMANKGIKAQFAIDTGMNRIGLDGDDVNECERIIRKYYSAFETTGIFTHLCVADTKQENEFTQNQIHKFKNIVNQVQDLKFSYIHCMNSAGGLLYPTYGNIVRLGIILYGLKPDYNFSLPYNIKPALVWKSVVSMVKQVYEGESIGYGRTFVASKNMVVATITTGYADGYNRALSNRGIVMIHGKKAPIVGRICMDQMMVDVSNIENVSIEDEVILLDSNYSADEMACLCETIGYEVVCNISKRVARIYI